MGVSIACRTVGLERVWGCQLHVEQWDCRECRGVHCMLNSGTGECGGVHCM